MNNADNIQNNDKLVLIIPGLTGSSQTNYITALVREIAQERQFAIAIYTYRMLSEKVTFKKGKYVDLVNDLYLTIKHIKEKNP